MIMAKQLFVLHAIILVHRANVISCQKKKKQKQTVVMSYARVTITFNLLEGEK